MKKLSLKLFRFKNWECSVIFTGQKFVKKNNQTKTSAYSSFM